ncbi:MAG: SCO family protein [Gammaproteobacteria bacterium]|nr:SCO family protein [Gammaproteobacteria bacterium]
MHCRVFMLCLLFIAATVGAATYNREAAMDISQAAIGRNIGEHTLRDVNGQPFALSELRGKPFVVSMIYTSCHHVCPLITKNLAATVEIAREALGDESFAVISVGFDWRVDTPEQMRNYAAQQGVRSTNWHLLSADAGTVTALSDALGFQFFSSAKGFDHLAQTTLVDRDGKIYRQVYGVDIDTQSLVEPLKELVFNTPREAGFLRHWADTFKLFCTVYDPNSDRYRFDYSIIMTIFAGTLSLGAIAFFIVREWRHSR